MMEDQVQSCLANPIVWGWVWRAARVALRTVAAGSDALRLTPLGQLAYPESFLRSRE